MIVTPGTQKILRDAQKAGYIDILVDAGAVVSNPTCGACLGGYMGILGDGEFVSLQQIEILLGEWEVEVLKYI